MERDRTPLTLLVVEDNPGDYLIIEDLLEERMFAPELLHATSFEEARNILGDRSPDIHVVLLDLSLPDKEGEDLIKAIISLVPDHPVIVLTGYSEADFAIKSLSLGVSDYLLKENLTDTVLYKSIIYNIERNRNLVNLQNSQKQYSDLFHLSPQPMWVYDRNTYAFLDVNNAAIRHYGYTFEEFMGLTIMDIRPESEIPNLRNVVELLKTEGTAFFKGVFTHCKKNGDPIVAEILSNTLEFRGRQGRLVLANDITERLRQIKAIEEQNERLREIAWLQSHLVRAPLARLLALVDAISSTPVTAEEQVQLLKRIETSALELDGVIKGIVLKAEAINLDDNK